MIFSQVRQSQWPSQSLLDYLFSSQTKLAAKSVIVRWFVIVNLQYLTSFDDLAEDTTTTSGSSTHASSSCPSTGSNHNLNSNEWGIWKGCSCVMVTPRMILVSNCHSSGLLQLISFHLTVTNLSRTVKGSRVAFKIGHMIPPPGFIPVLPPLQPRMIGWPRSWWLTYVLACAQIHNNCPLECLSPTLFSLYLLPGSWEENTWWSPAVDPKTGSIETPHNISFFKHYMHNFAYTHSQLTSAKIRNSG